MSAGNNFDQYELKRRAAGRLCLPDKRHEAAAKLLADGHTEQEVLTLLPELTEAELQATLGELLTQKRIAYLSKQANRDNNPPSTPDECLAYVKETLLQLSKSAESDNAKINALKALAAVAIDERKNKPTGATEPTSTLSAYEVTVEGAE